MSARRWFVLLGFVLVNLVLSVGWFVWAAINAPPGNRMAAMGLTEEVCRLPLVPPTPASRDKILNVLQQLKMLGAAARI